MTIINIPSFSGGTGIQGDTGIAGVTGIAGGGTGLQGLTGIQGVTGIAGGGTGLQGLTGIQGDTGIVGPIGTTGPSGGVQGETGVQGLQGIQGITGLIGETGIQGIQGDTGIQGETGIIGSTGVQGIAGDIGTTGIQGETGLGTTGDIGETGLQGATGVGAGGGGSWEGTDPIYPATANAGITGIGDIRSVNGDTQYWIGRDADQMFELKRDSAGTCLFNLKNTGDNTGSSLKLIMTTHNVNPYISSYSPSFSTATLASKLHLYNSSGGILLQTLGGLEVSSTAPAYTGVPELIVNNNMVGIGGVTGPNVSLDVLGEINSSTAYQLSGVTGVSGTVEEGNFIATLAGGIITGVTGVGWSPA